MFATMRQLDSDWSRLRVQPDAIDTARRWRIIPAPVSDLEQVRSAIDARDCPTTAHRVIEHRVRRLVSWAATDHLAARVVVQRMAPGLVAVARRRSPHQRDDDLAHLLAAAWIAVRTFRPQRNPGHTVAALVGDAQHLAFRVGRRQCWVESPTATLPERIVDDREVDPLVELAALVTHAQLTDREHELVRLLVTAESMVSVADELGITARSVRSRRNRLAARLRDAA